MLNKLREGFRDLATFRRDQAVTHERLDAIEGVLQDYLTAVRSLEEQQGVLDATVHREVMSMAELYGKTYRLLKRMQAEERADVEEEPPPTPDIAPVVTDATTERVLARRNRGVSVKREG